LAASKTVVVIGMKNGNANAIAQAQSHKPLCKVSQFWRHTWKPSDRQQHQLHGQEDQSANTMKGVNGSTEQDKEQDISSLWFSYSWPTLS